MPVGRPDSDPHFAGEYLESYADRLIREAMEAGRFDDLRGSGEPIPGAGTKDDDLWWVRSWIRRNRPPDDQSASNSS